jgi:hypothetical protein
MTVSVTVRDGERAVAVDQEKVAVMFEVSGDLGDWAGAGRPPCCSGQGATGCFARDEQN